MDWGKIIVEATGVALISAAGVIIATLLANLITDIKGYKKIAKQIGNTDNTTLSGQHERIETMVDERYSGLKEAVNSGNERLTGSIKDTISKVENVGGKVENIDKILAVEAKTKEMLYQSLDKDQQEIKRHVDGIMSLARNWEEVNARNKELERQVKELIVENERLKSKYDQLLVEMKGLKTKDKEMER